MYQTSFFKMNTRKFNRCSCEESLSGGGQWVEVESETDLEFDSICAAFN